MNLTKILILLVAVLYSPCSDSFKKDQLRYPRVRRAYQDKEASMQSLMKARNLNSNEISLYLRAFKNDKELELWGKNNSDDTYQLIKTYSICQTSGQIGPKRKQGDLQIPEGFYHINRFNPSSNFYLSMGINYPNRSDKILGEKGNLGNDIFIHGACVTIGCLPITDEQIKELYIFCVEARNNGQSTIPITIFPSRLSDSEFKRLSKKYSSDKDKTRLWSDLKLGYEIFNRSKKLPSIGFLNSGRHLVSE